MNREKIMQAIVDEFRKRENMGMVYESLKWISDMNLLGFAISLGIDTDAILARKEISHAV